MDYGSFAEARRKGGEEESICFEFGLSLQPIISLEGLGFQNELIPFTLIDEELEINLSVFLQETKQRTYASMVELNIGNDHSEIAFNEKGGVFHMSNEGIIPMAWNCLKSHGCRTMSMSMSMSMSKNDRLMRRQRQRRPFGPPPRWGCGTHPYLKGRSDEKVAEHLFPPDDGTWEELGHLLFSWGCATRKVRLS